jgi:thioredoxin reductase
MVNSAHCIRQFAVATTNGSTSPQVVVACGTQPFKLHYNAASQITAGEINY